VSSLGVHSANSQNILQAQPPTSASTSIRPGGMVPRRVGGV
jgi:hypothetical protein